MIPSYIKIYISLIIFGAIIFCFIFFVFSPVQKQTKEDSQEAIIQRQKLLALKSREASLVKLREDYLKVGSGLEKIDNLFLDTDYPLESLNYLEKTAQDSGVKINTSAPSYLKENQPWPCFSVQISL